MRFWALLAAAMAALTACSTEDSTVAGPEREGRFGIYRLRLDSGATELLFSCEDELAHPHLDPAGERLAFTRYWNGGGLDSTEICVLDLDGGEPRRLTRNQGWDLYPRWSPEGDQLAYLSWPPGAETLDIWRMGAEGQSPERIYDSGFNDADIDWRGDRIAFTRESRIWTMDEQGQEATVLSDPPHAGEWGQANLPFGDYDPRWRPDGEALLLTRLVGDDCAHGDYDFFLLDPDSGEETRLTETGWTQGLAEWSRDGSRLVFILAARQCQGLYDLYFLDPESGDAENATAAHFPSDFLCRAAVFGPVGEYLYLIGEWWLK